MAPQGLGISLACHVSDEHVPDDLRQTFMVYYGVAVAKDQFGGTLTPTSII